MEIIVTRRRVAYDQVAFDREYGRHSNIPECCIEFWVTHIAHIMNNPRLYNIYGTLQSMTESRIKKDFRYRPCLDCLRSGHWHELHVCDGKPCENLTEILRDKYAY